ncbi:hypothetical protein V8E36_001648 [Tilletia maclaganii]
MRLSSALLLIASALPLLATAQAQAQAQQQQQQQTCTSTITTVQGSARSYQMVDSPIMPHSQDWGWDRLAEGNTEVCLANLYRNIKIFPGSSATVPIYESNDVDLSQVTRVILGVQAKGADSWHYWTNLANTRNKAWGNNASFDKGKVSIVVPQFIRQQDKDAGAAVSTDLWFDDATYGFGGYAIGGPPGSDPTSISSLDVLDRLIDWIEARYPSVKRIVLVGHSRGAELISRYAYLRHDAQSTKARLDFVFMNAGTYPYSYRWRPVGVNSTDCPDFDTWPWGFAASANPDTIPPYAAADHAKLGRKGLLARFASRNVHLLLGNRDLGGGTGKCEAFAQGKGHWNRGRFFAESVINGTGAKAWAEYNRVGGRERFKSSVEHGQGGLPATWTYDVTTCSHDQECMYQSDAGIQRIMLDKSAPAPAAAKPARSRSKRHTHAQALLE